MNCHIPDPQDFVSMYFDADWRPMIYRLFQDGVDSGLRRPEAVVERVKSNANDYLESDDDNDQARKVIATLLRWLGYDPDSALAQAISLIRECEADEDERDQRRLQGLPPTARQVESLKHHGYEGSMPTNRGEADKLIRRLETEGGAGVKSQR